MYSCYNCGHIFSDAKIGFREECPGCMRDAHVCLNCIFFDKSYYNECRETKAERVLDKEKQNFCDYFSFKSNGPGNIPPKNDVNKSKDAFNNLFND
jgi:hypothetical protein